MLEILLDKNITSPSWVHWLLAEQKFNEADVKLNSGIQKRFYKPLTQNYRQNRQLPIAIFILLGYYLFWSMLLDWFIIVSSVIFSLKQVWFRLKANWKNRRLLCQIDDCNQHVILGEAASSGKRKVKVSSGFFDQELTAGTIDNNSITNEKTMNVQTLGRSLTDRIDNQMGNIVKTVANGI